MNIARLHYLFGRRKKIIFFQAFKYCQQIANFAKERTLSKRTTVLSKAALLSCARFTCDIYANFSLIAKFQLLARSSAAAMRTAIQREQRGAGNRSLGRFGIDCERTMGPEPDIIFFHKTIIIMVSFINRQTEKIVKSSSSYIIFSPS